MSNYADVLAAIRARIGAHNEGSDPEDRVDADAVIRAVKRLGGTTVDGLAQLAEAELVQAGLPLGVARLARQIVAAPGSAPAQVSTPPAAMRIELVDKAEQAAAMSDQDLLRAYRWDRPGAVGIELDLRAGGSGALGDADAPKFLVYDGSVLVEDLTIRRMRATKAMRSGGAPVTSAVRLASGRTVEPLAVGQEPHGEMKILQRNPIYTRRALTAEETCTVTGRSWAGVPDDVRALLVVAVDETRECTPHTVTEARAIISTARGADAYATLSGDYPKAAIAYERMPAARKQALLEIAADEVDDRPFVDDRSCGQGPVRSITPVRFLDDEIRAIYRAAIDARFSDRASLLVGVSPTFVAGLPRVGSFGGQILVDLHRLNDVGALADGSVPLHAWLSNAEGLAGSRREAIVFRQALDKYVRPSSPLSLRDRLCALLPAQFDDFVVRAGVPQHYIAGPSAPQSTRAGDVVRWIDQQGRAAEATRILDAIVRSR